MSRRFAPRNDMQKYAPVRISNYAFPEQIHGFPPFASGTAPRHAPPQGVRIATPVCALVRNDMQKLTACQRLQERPDMQKADELLRVQRVRARWQTRNCSPIPLAPGRCPSAPPLPCTEISTEQEALSMDTQHILLSSTLFAGVAAGDLQAMLGCLGGVQRSYGKGQDIFCPGDRIQDIGLVLAGTVHLCWADFWGNRNLLTAVRPGEVFGEAYACLPDRPAPLGAVAAEPATVLFLNVRRILTTCPSACTFHTRVIRNLVETLAARSRTMNEKLIHLTQRTTRDKVLSYLSAESLRQGSSRIVIGYNRQQLADYLSVERSALSAELSRLRQQGILDFHKNQFILKRQV